MSPDTDNDSGTATARARTGTVSASREQEWLILLKLAAEEVFEIMCGSRLVEAITPEPSPGENFTAMVGLTGSLRGVVTFYCGGDSARQIAMRLLRSEVDCTNDEVCDAMGEICNMVAGNFKNKITGLSGPCLLGVPGVVTGNAYRFRSLASGESLETVVSLDGQPLIVRLDIHR